MEQAKTIDRFCFNSEWRNKIEALPTTAQRTTVYDAICYYCFYGKIPEIDPLTPEGETWLSIYPQAQKVRAKELKRKK